MTPKRILYIGGGDDISPAIHFPTTKEFVFVDSRPRGLWNDHCYDPDTYDAKFLHSVFHKFACYGFSLTSIAVVSHGYCVAKMPCCQWLFCPTVPTYSDPSLIVMYNHMTKQTIRYYTSVMNEDFFEIDTLHHDLQLCDSLVIRYVKPTRTVLDNFPKVFVYDDCDYAEDTFDGVSTVTEVNARTGMHFEPRKL